MIKSLGGKRYRLIVSIGGRGNRKRYTRTVECENKREAQRLYVEFEAECMKNPLTDMTVHQLMDAHLAHVRMLNRKATTIRGYQTIVKRLQKPTEGILAKNLSTGRLEKIIAEMSSNGLASKTIKSTIGFLSAAYDHAIQIGELENNPCDKVTLPQGKAREIRILYKHEIVPFMNAIADIDLNEKVAYELALFLGLRRSEILGLKEKDVDIIRGLISIHNTRHRVDGEDIEQDTKTVRSTRVLALPDILIMDIARLLEIHRQFPYEKTDWLIQDGFGEPLGHQALSSRLTRLEDRNGLPHVTLHGLRHTYASILHSKGVDMANISAELGHSNLTTTANIYTHIFNSASASSRGIADTVNGFLSENSDDENDGK